MFIDSTSQSRHVLHEALEDGTLPYTSIIALNVRSDVDLPIDYVMQLQAGFDVIEGIGMSVIQQQAFDLAAYTYKAMADMHHVNGAPLCVVYSQSDFCSPNAQVCRIFH